MNQPLPHHESVPDGPPDAVAWSEPQLSFTQPLPFLGNQNSAQQQLLSADEQRYLTDFFNSMIGENGEEAPSTVASLEYFSESAGDVSGMLPAHGGLLPVGLNANAGSNLDANSRTAFHVHEPGTTPTALYQNTNVGGAVKRRVATTRHASLPSSVTPLQGYRDPTLKSLPGTPYDYIDQRSSSVSPTVPSSVVSLSSPVYSYSSQASSPSPHSSKGNKVGESSAARVGLTESTDKRHAVKNGFAALARLVPGVLPGQSSGTAKPPSNQQGATSGKPKSAQAAANPSKSIILTKAVEYVALLQKENLAYANELHLLLQAYAHLSSTKAHDPVLSETLYQLSVQSALLDACSDTVQFLNNSFTPSVPMHSYFESFPYILNPFVQHIDYDVFLRETTPPQAFSHPGLIEPCQLRHSRKPT